MRRDPEVRRAAGIFVSGLIFILLFLVHPAAAMEVAGVDVPQSITVDNKVLVLNGAGIRKKLFIKVYVGSLYLAVRHSTPDEILSDPRAKSIVMNILYHEVSAERLIAAWNDGFAGNSTPEDLKNLQDRVNQFNALFSPVRKGDVIKLVYLPQQGTQVWINDTLKGAVAGEDFQRALLEIWLGPKPVDADLKEAMLGKE